MKLRHILMMAALNLTAAASLTSCEDILGHWEKPTPVAPTPEELITKYEFKVIDLADADIAGITTVKLTDAAGAVSVTATLGDNGNYIVEKSDLTTATMPIWVEVTTGASETYIQKLTAEDLSALETSKKLAMATLGDVINSDGTFSAAAVGGKTPIGVIAYLNQSGTEDDEITEKSQGAGHGLVLCLKNAASGDDAQWSTKTSSYEFGESAKVNSTEALKRTNDISGYANTKLLAEKATASTDYKAAYAAFNYTGLTAPANTTGWFLPSIQQWVKILVGLAGMPDGDIKWSTYAGLWFGEDLVGLNKIEAALAKAGTGNYDSMLPVNYYWSITESYTDAAANLLVAESVKNPWDGTTEYKGFILWYTEKDKLYSSFDDTEKAHGNFNARPVLAF